MTTQTNNWPLWMDGKQKSWKSKGHCEWQWSVWHTEQSAVCGCQNVGMHDIQYRWPIYYWPISKRVIIIVSVIEFQSTITSDNVLRDVTRLEPRIRVVIFASLPRCSLCLTLFAWGRGWAPHTQRTLDQRGHSRETETDLRFIFYSTLVKYSRIRL